MITRVSADRRGRRLPPLSSVLTVRNKRGAGVEATGSGSGWVSGRSWGAWFHVPKAMRMRGEHSAPSGTIARVLLAADLPAPVSWRSCTDRPSTRRSGADPGEQRQDCPIHRNTLFRDDRYNVDSGATWAKPVGRSCPLGNQAVGLVGGVWVSLSAEAGQPAFVWPDRGRGPFVGSAGSSGPVAARIHDRILG